MSFDWVEEKYCSKQERRSIKTQMKSGSTSNLLFGWERKCVCNIAAESLNTFFFYWRVSNTSGNPTLLRQSQIERHVVMKTAFLA